ncbi:hypothetical protein [uncultured Kordia sp.]|uniref:hypothetical protein n=1 Tax=uncultured Kordia sp. TaxID=507699 RepID=UPI00262B9A6D|nr:hypothetical protein [uncultured Kordia sp.]
MLEIIIMIAVGRQFYELAKKYEQQLAWLYAILGVVSYYGGAFVAGIIIGVYSEFSGSYILDNLSDIQLTFIFLPIGILACWGFYQLLKKNWKKKFEEIQRLKPKISDIGKPEKEEKPTEDFLIGNKDLGDLSKKKDTDDWRF